MLTADHLGRIVCADEFARIAKEEARFRKVAEPDLQKEEQRLHCIYAEDFPLASDIYLERGLSGLDAHARNGHKTFSPEITGYFYVRDRIESTYDVFRTQREILGAMAHYVGVQATQLHAHGDVFLYIGLPRPEVPRGRAALGLQNGNLHILQLHFSDQDGTDQDDIVRIEQDAHQIEVAADCPRACMERHAHRFESENLCGFRARDPCMSAYRLQMRPLPE
ncbi:MAG: hypothetical protein ACOCWQ_02810 [Nanoarchaeota archaeon]